MVAIKWAELGLKGAKLAASSYTDMVKCCAGLFIYGYCIYYYFFRSDM